MGASYSFLPLLRLQDYPSTCSFATAKAGLAGLARTVAAENAELGITASVVAPSETPGASVRLPGDGANPRGEADLASVADACAFFSSQEFARVTGQILLAGAVNAADGEPVIH